jgi:hypothetical protein
MALDGSEPPLKVSLVAGEWLEQMRGNRQVLADFGDVRRIAAIPAGRPSGAWAQSIGLALQQRWREWANEARIVYAGEENRPTPQFRKSFTRYGLLDLFRCEPYVEDVLAGHDPGRARKYWNDAIGLLKEQQVIGYYKEAGPLPGARKGWQDAWLHHQKLDIRPATLEDTQAIAELARRPKSANKARAKKGSRKTKSLPDPGS